MGCARWLVGVLAFSLVLHAAASAQIASADIVGRVTDSSGAVLPGAAVTIENIATRDVRNTVTSDTGDYVFNLLPIGTYTIRIELQGFQTQVARMTVASGDRARVDAKLQLGAICETVEVSGESPLLQTDSSTVGALFTEKAVQDLPVPGRNIVRLVQMIPGANEGQVSSLANGTRPDDRRQTSSVSINGTADTQNNQLVDGLDNNERAIGTVGVKPSIDAIAEVKVQTNLYSAETGRTLGGVINILTKSGSNEFHGTAYDYARNDRFRLTQLLRDHQAEAHRRISSVAALAGRSAPTGRSSSSTTKGYRSTQGVANLITVPTARMRGGDFSELSAESSIRPPAGTPFAGNVIPSEPARPDRAPSHPALSAAERTGAGEQLLERDGSHAGSRYDRFSYRSPFQRQQHAVCPLLLSTGSTPSRRARVRIVDGIDPNCIVGGIAAGGAFPGPNHTTAHNVVASYVRVFNPSLIGEFKGGFNHRRLPRCRPTTRRTSERSSAFPTRTSTTRRPDFR